jgi:predicted nucleic acid-binding protein
MLIESLPIVEGAQSASERVRNVLPLAREFGLSPYDAAYLELAVRSGAAPATLDARLEKGARGAEVEVFTGR